MQYHKEASRTDNKIWTLASLFFKVLYLLLQTFINRLSDSEIESVPMSAATVATRADNAFSSQSGSNRKSFWYVEPVLSWLSWKMQSSSDIFSIP